MLYNGSSNYFYLLLLLFFPGGSLKSLNYTKSNKKIISDIDKIKQKQINKVL